MSSRPSEIQAQYYAETSSRYDDMHVREGDEHDIALRHVSGLISSFGYRSVLDVGSGTGRALRFLTARHPDLDVRGVEPIDELVDVAVEKYGIPPGMIVSGQGERLPFPDGSFDAVLSVSIMHHVERPDTVLREMMRVARRAVLVSDVNRFAYGSPALRLTKLALYRSGLWRAADYVRNRGRRWRFTEDDGVFYSYSVFDSYAILGEWADRVALIPTVRADSASWLHPLVTSTHALMCGLRD